MYFVPQATTYYKLRPTFLRPNDYPPRGWSSVPVPLTETAVSTVNGTTIFQFGIKFEVPWQGIEKEQNQRCDTETVFKTRQAVRLSNPGCFDRTPISSYTSHLNPDDVKLAFPSGVHESKYEQYRAVISAKPSQLLPFLSHQDFVRLRVLLEIKGLWFEHNSDVPTILSFTTNKFRGFEIIGTSPDGDNIVLELFDRADQHWFTLVVLGRGTSLTQPEINRIIDSIGIVSPSQGLQE